MSTDPFGYLEWADQQSNNGEEIRDPLDERSSPPALDEYDIQQVVEDEFGAEVWPVMEAVLATHATLLLDGMDRSQALMIEGPSGSGKTMLLKPLKELASQLIRRENITPASFVSAEPSKTEEELEEADLLPQIDEKTLVVKDVGPWFGGSREQIKRKWAVMSSVMDGGGHVRHTASHGARGYDDIRFNFIGATTPLKPRAWDVMGNVGQRLLFIEWPEEPECGEEAIDDFNDAMEGSEHKPINRLREPIHRFLQDLWTYYGGAASVTPVEERPKAVQDAHFQLTEIVRYGRATYHSRVERVDREARKRVGRHLKSLAQGRALLHGRDRIEIEDFELAGRVALSSIPKRRRRLFRVLLDPTKQDEWNRSDIEKKLDIGKDAALSRLKQFDALGLVERYKETVRGGKSNVIRPVTRLRWPRKLDFPEEYR